MYVRALSKAESTEKPTKWSMIALHLYIHLVNGMNEAVA